MGGLWHSVLTKSSLHHDLTDPNWEKCAVRLSISRSVKCFDAAMHYRQFVCGKRALSIFLHQKITDVRTHCTLEDLCAKSQTLGVPLKVLWEQDELPSKCGVVVSMRKHKQDAGGSYAYMFIVTGMGEACPTEAFQKARSSIPEHHNRLLLCMYHPGFYPHNHCVVLRRVNNVWYLSDPLMPSGCCMKIPTLGLFWMLIIGATSVLGQNERD
jgi:hypothetical protein